MENKREHIKTWDEKLQENGVPYSPESWQAMEGLLDAEMPVQKKKGGRRWIMTVILLLLLIGICNIPGINKLNNFSASKNSGSPLIKEDSALEVSDKDVPHRTNKNLHPLSFSRLQPVKNALPLPIKKVQTLLTKDVQVLSAKPAMNKTGRPVVKETKPGRQVFISANKKQSAKKPGKEVSGPKTQQPGTGAPSVPGIPDKNSLTMHSPETVNTDTAKIKKPIDSVKNKISSAKKPNKPMSDPTVNKENKEDSTEDARGFVLALGLNQFFVVGNQDKTNYNSNGTSGNLSDYIPVPVGRYYFHKWFYVQGEAQLNAPQYTKTLLIGQGEKNSFNQSSVQSVFVKKLFYFNIPLSVHYSPVKNLFIGAGLQFSLLTNGVGLIQDTRTMIGFPPNIVNPSDTGFLSASVQNIKTDSSYKELKTSEWRFLVDVNYQWKRLTLGLRYNQAFSDFVNVRISTANITQAHNSSLQLYIRYMIWDKRKKFMIPK